MELKVVFFDIGETLGRLVNGRLEAFADSASLLGTFQALGLRIGVITNVDTGWTAARVLVLLAEARLDRFITPDYIVTSFDVDAAKPDPLIYGAAAKRAGLPPKACMYVGEQKSETDGASAAGMCSICVPSRKQLPTVPNEPAPSPTIK